MLEPNDPINMNKGGRILSKNMQNNKMSSTKNTDYNSVSNNKMVIRYVFRLCLKDVQFDNKETGIIIVVSKTKYIDIPSTPK